MNIPGLSCVIKGSRLILTADADTRELLRTEFPNGECSDAQLADILEPLTCNSELDWVLPEYTGDLTGAPMLGIYGEPRIAQRGRLAGC